MSSESEWQTYKRRVDARLRAVRPAPKGIHYRDGLDLTSYLTRDEPAEKLLERIKL